MAALLPVDEALVRVLDGVAPVAVETVALADAIRNSDIGTLYIVQHELLKDAQVDLAGVILRHPLTSEYRMRVNSSKGSPIKEIEKATKSAIESAQELKQLIHSKIKGV